MTRTLISPLDFRDAFEQDRKTDDTSSASGSDADSATSPEPPKRCKHCSKPESSLIGVTLKRCSRCQSASYCSTECQKADWPQHKSTCKKPGYIPPPGMSSTGNFLDAMFGGNNLDKLPEKDCFAQLIDSYRLRVEDDYVFTGELSGLYSGEDPRIGFRRFLNMAEKKTGLLPTWWCKEKRRECERFAVDPNNWSDLNCAVEKHDIIEHYGDSSMPMKLRLLAEKVYGKGVKTPW